MNTNQQETVHYQIFPQLHSLELLQATYRNHSFTKHIHEGYAIGIIERGALAFTYQGTRLVASAGTINLVIPGEAHDGAPASPDGWTYRMFYLPPTLLEQAVFSLSGKKGKLPFFPDGTITDTKLAGFIWSFHCQLLASQLSLMEQQSQLSELLSEFVKRHAADRYHELRTGQEHLAVSRAREYLETMYQQAISLDELSRHCHLSPYHLLRVFRNNIGIPPHVYLKQVRVKKAKELLSKGFAPAFITQEVGFADQSHFTRNFKQITGLTPSKYSNIVQANSVTKAMLE